MDKSDVGDKKTEDKSDYLEEELREAKEKIDRLEKKSELDEDRDYKQTLYKSESTTLVLSIVLGILGINGIGHIYLGRIGKGIAILIGSIILYGIGWATIFVGVGAIFLIIYIVIFIWQIIDSRKLCQEYNEHVRSTGDRPW